MRAFWIVLDSVGIGNAADASLFGDEGSDTWKSCYDTGNLHVPNMEKLGMYHIDGMQYGRCKEKPMGCYGRMQEQSMGKDTTIGHWEMTGVISKKPLPVYPKGFPKELLDAFTKMTGREVICNQPYSGTEVIRDYGKEHIETGKLIVYTSADSVFQIAAHESVVSVETLYDYCQMARKILNGEHAVARVIARPFSGEYPDFIRTDRRHDFSLEPPKPTILDQLQETGKTVVGIGKISDIFAGKGISKAIPNHGNDENMKAAVKVLEEDFEGLCYINLVDFDMIYGHRRDVEGYTQALNQFDKQLGEFLPKMRSDDILLITADHGCDPKFKGSDHTRETVPFLCYGDRLQKGVNLGIRKTYADIAATLGEWFQVPYDGAGESFAKQTIIY